MQATMMAMDAACCGATGATSTATTLRGATTAIMAAVSLLHQALLLLVGSFSLSKHCSHGLHMTCLGKVQLSYLLKQLWKYLQK